MTRLNKAGAENKYLFHKNKKIKNEKNVQEKYETKRTGSCKSY